jgi:hypothetical protein
MEKSGIEVAPSGHGSPLKKKKPKEKIGIFKTART